MNSIFSYDSPMMQILMYIGDLIILNFIFLLCCIPVFTIGAAQAGLYTAIRVLNDKEDDSSPTAAFFRGFKSGFGTVTLSWGLLGLLLVISGIAAVFAGTLGLPRWLCILPLFILAAFMSLVPAFHSRFGCTAMQLYRNVFLLLLTHPLRSIGAAVLMWVPVIVMYYSNLYNGMATSLIWLTIYYSAAALFGELFLRKPFGVLVEEFNRRQKEAEGDCEEEPSDEETEKIFSDVIE